MPDKINRCKLCGCIFINDTDGEDNSVDIEIVNTIDLTDTETEKTERVFEKKKPVKIIKKPAKVTSEKCNCVQKCTYTDQCAQTVCSLLSTFNGCNEMSIVDLLNTVITPVTLPHDVLAVITTLGSVVPPKSFVFNLCLPTDAKTRIEILWSPTPILKSIWEQIYSIVSTVQILNPFNITVTVNIKADGNIIDPSNPIMVQNRSGTNEWCSPCNLFGSTTFSIRVYISGFDVTTRTISGALSLINPQGVIFRDSSLPENQPNNDGVADPTTIAFTIYPDGNIIYYLGQLIPPIIRPISQYSPAIYASLTQSCSNGQWILVNLTSLTL